MKILHFTIQPTTDDNNFYDEWVTMDSTGQIVRRTRRKANKKYSFVNIPIDGVSPGCMCPPDEPQPACPVHGLEFDRMRVG